MGFLNWALGLFSGSSWSADEPMTINPASGLPMMGGVDAAGNPFGTDHHQSADAHRWDDNWNDHWRWNDDFHHHYDHASSQIGSWDDHF